MKIIIKNVLIFLCYLLFMIFWLLGMGYLWMYVIVPNPCLYHSKDLKFPLNIFAYQDALGHPDPNIFYYGTGILIFVIASYLVHRRFTKRL